EHRIRADVHVLVDARGPLREPRAESDEEALAARLERQPVERTSQEDAGEARHERARLRAHDEERHSATLLLTAPQDPDRGDRGEEGGVDGALQIAADRHQLPVLSNCAAAPRCFLKRAEWSASEKRTRAGISWSARRPWQKSRIRVLNDAGSSGCARRTVATTICPMIGLFSPWTSTSATFSIASSRFSTSVGRTLLPPTLMTSVARPRMRSHSPSRSTRSPVSKYPSSSNGLGALR